MQFAANSFDGQKHKHIPSKHLILRIIYQANVYLFRVNNRSNRERGMNEIY